MSRHHDDRPRAAAERRLGGKTHERLAIDGFDEFRAAFGPGKTRARPAARTMAATSSVRIVIGGFAAPARLRPRHDFHQGARPRPSA